MEITEEPIQAHGKDTATQEGLSESSSDDFIPSPPSNRKRTNTNITVEPTSPMAVNTEQIILTQDDLAPFMVAGCTSSQAGAHFYHSGGIIPPYSMILNGASEADEMLLPILLKFVNVVMGHQICLDDTLSCKPFYSHFFSPSLIFLP